MGFFSSLFGGKSEKEREMEAIFEKVNRFLNDDKTQMLAIPEVLRGMYDSAHVDKVADAVGEFGRDPRNPIPCNGPVGEITYLSKLVIDTPNGTIPVTFHRRGSEQVNGRGIDIYEIISYDGFLYDVLYMYMYYTTKSTLCPKGYKLEKSCIGFRGTSSCNSEFPSNQYQVVIDCAKRILGFPAFDTKLKNLDVEEATKTIAFCRKVGIDNVRWW